MPRQQIQYCTTSDGVRLAYSVIGKGTPDALALFLGDPPIRGPLPGAETFRERVQKRIQALERSWLVRAVVALSILAGAAISFVQLCRLLRQ